jgi:hypothetical protein
LKKAPFHRPLANKKESSQEKWQLSFSLLRSQSSHGRFLRSSGLLHLQDRKTPLLYVLPSLHLSPLDSSAVALSHRHHGWLTSYALNQGTPKGLMLNFFRAVPRSQCYTFLVPRQFPPCGGCSMPQHRHSFTKKKLSMSWNA